MGDNFGGHNGVITVVLEGRKKNQKEMSPWEQRLE